MVPILAGYQKSSTHIAKKSDKTDHLIGFFPNELVGVVTLITTLITTLMTTYVVNTCCVTRGLIALWQHLSPQRSPLVTDQVIKSS